MEIDLNSLLKGKATRIKDKEFFSTEAYVTPFLDRVSKMTDNFVIKVKPADQISLTKSGEINFDDVVYNRVWVQGILPGEYCYNNHVQAISLLYALDTRKPVVKIFNSAVNSACLNLCVFNPMSLSVSELEPETPINFKPLKDVLEVTNDIKSTLDRLSSMEFKREEIYYNLGKWVDNCINYKYKNDFGTIKLPESLPVDAYKSLFYDTKSMYYTNDNIVDGFTVYNSFTYLVSNDKDRDIVNKCEKILLIKNIMNI